jgi:hypothetical protein
MHQDRSRNADQETRASEYQARIAELEAALKPFADLAGAEEARYENCTPPDTFMIAVFLRDIRRARAALRNRLTGG